MNYSLRMSKWRLYRNFPIPYEYQAKIPQGLSKKTGFDAMIL